MIAYGNLLGGPYFASKGAHLPTCPSYLPLVLLPTLDVSKQWLAKRATYPYLPTTLQVRLIIVPQHSKCLPRSKSPPRGQTHALVPTCKSLPALFLPFISIEMRRSSTLRQRFFRYLPYNGYLSSLLSTDETFYGIPRTFVLQPPCDTNVYATTTK